MTQLRRAPRARDDGVPSRLIAYPLSKRILDKLVASVLIVAVAPLFLVATVAAALASKGRPFRCECRVSRGRTFELLKFRTVRLGLAGELRLLERDPVNLTWAGRWLLKPWYLDEMPQLLNVLRGDMSIVGPRAWPPDMVDQQVATGLDYRLRIMAGLTGPAQATKGMGESRYVDLDLFYVEKCKTLRGWALVRYDLGVIARSLRVLARREGLTY